MITDPNLMSKPMQTVISQPPPIMSNLANPTQQHQSEEDAKYWAKLESMRQQYEPLLQMKLQQVQTVMTQRNNPETQQKMELNVKQFKKK